MGSLEFKGHFGRSRIIRLGPRILPWSAGSSSMASGFLKRNRVGISFVVVGAALFGLYFLWNWAAFSLTVGDKVFPPLEPKKVNLIGIDLAGEKIIVANGIAQLVQDEGGGFESREQDGQPVGATGAKIPMAALVSTLQGSAEGLEELVMALNKIEHEILPDERYTWDASDIRKALDGDSALQAKLENDLNTTLSGEPTSTLSRETTFSGIWIRVPISVTVLVANESRTVDSTVALNYTTELVRRVQRHDSVRNKFDVDGSTLSFVYEEVWGSLRGSPAADVRRSLERFIDPERSRTLSSPAERLLARVNVLVTDIEIEGVSLEEFPRADGKGNSYTINLELNRNGRDRLWQYTRKNPGCQLLFVVDGVAIAAPVVQHEMKYYTAAIKNILEEDLAREAVDLIKNSKVSKL